MFKLAATMENKKRSRTVPRSSFTKLVNEMAELIGNDSLDIDALTVTFDMLKSKLDELAILDTEIYELMLESDASDEDLSNKVNRRDEYIKKFTFLRVKYEKLVVSRDSEDLERQSSRSSASSETTKKKRRFKLPAIQFDRYDGSVKGWLTFWGQFKKIHENDSIDASDKIEYLKLATVEGSRTRHLVESYPAMGENYAKIIDNMRSRFAQKDLQIEVHVRELLKLILSNATCKRKIDVANLYDSIET